MVDDQQATAGDKDAGCLFERRTGCLHGHMAEKVNREDGIESGSFPVQAPGVSVNEVNARLREGGVVPSHLQEEGREVEPGEFGFLKAPADRGKRRPRTAAKFQDTIGGALRDESRHQIEELALAHLIVEPGNEERIEPNASTRQVALREEVPPLQVPVWVGDVCVCHGRRRGVAETLAKTGARDSFQHVPMLRERSFVALQLFGLEFGYHKKVRGFP
jgi:hypothetical protein